MYSTSYIELLLLNSMQFAIDAHANAISSVASSIAIVTLSNRGTTVYAGATIDIYVHFGGKDTRYASCTIPTIMNYLNDV